MAGGGVALLRAASAIDGLTLEGDEKVGASIVKRALEEPIRRIVENAGLEGSVVVEKVKAERGVTRGFDAESLEFVDMMQAGIIDPTRWSGWRSERGVGGVLLLTTRRWSPTCPRRAGGWPVDASRRLLGPGSRV